MDKSDEERIEQKSLDYAKKHKKAIAARLTDRGRYPAEVDPVSVFMAGAPGAGKTEASIELVKDLTGDPDGILRIDPDELRSEFHDYSGANAWLFQSAVSVLVEKVHDLALKQKQSFILDGTLARYPKAEENIRRSLRKDRVVQILYVYQEPWRAWSFVEARERMEGRNIRPQDFLGQYFASREVVNKLKKRFGKKIIVDLLVKNTSGRRFYEMNIWSIDDYVPESYSRDEVARMLGIVDRGT